MTANRATLLTKTHKVLKKHFKPVAPNLRAPLMHQLIYACCLEDATAEAADPAFAALETQYYDWNEVRVSTATELGESMHMLPAPKTAAARLKRVLQSVFEANYSFDLEFLKKENIGAAVKKLYKYKGVSPYAAAYVTQTALSGHSIPVGNGALNALYVIGVIDEKEKATGSVPGLERAIPKNKGIEFGSLLNQLGVEFERAPHAQAARTILVEIAPDAKDRLPKRRTKKAAEVEEAAAAAKAAASTGKGGKKTKTIEHAAKTPAKKTVAKKIAVKSILPKKKTVIVKRKKTSTKAKTAAALSEKKKVLKKKTASKTTQKRKPR